MPLLLYPVKGTISSTITSTYDEEKRSLCDEGHVEWKIPQFFTHKEYADEIWESSSFLFLNAEWCLRIELNNDHQLNSWKGLKLVVRNPSVSYAVTFTLSIGRLSQPCTYGPVTEDFDGNHTAFGKDIMFRKENLQRTNASDDFLKIYCSASASSFKACQKILQNRNTALCRDVQDLLLLERNPDLTIELRGQEFKAHKLILTARSPVFAAMFEHDMTEKKESVIKIEDCDPDIFKNFLQCMYGGRLENVSVDKIIPLYMVSHKYTVTDIMEECVLLMLSEMSEDTVFDILTLAARYNETGLKKAAEEFMAKNINKIFCTNNWKTLLTENSCLQKYL